MAILREAEQAIPLSLLPYCRTAQGMGWAAWLFPLGHSLENRKGLARAIGTSREIDCEAIGGKGG